MTWYGTLDFIIRKPKAPFLSKKLAPYSCYKIFVGSITSCLVELRIKPKHERYDKIHEMHYRPIRWCALGNLFSPG